MTIPETRRAWWNAKAAEVTGAAGGWVLIWREPTTRRGGRCDLVRRRLELRHIDAEVRSFKSHDEDAWQVWARVKS